MTMVDTADSRFAKALAIADQAGGWLRLRDNSGHCKAVGIPSSGGDRYYVVTRDRCDCVDFQRHHRPCKHMQGLEIAMARRQAELPARVVVDGLQQMVRDRAATNAQRYDDIFKRFEGD